MPETEMCMHTGVVFNHSSSLEREVCIDPEWTIVYCRNEFSLSVLLLLTAIEFLSGLLSLPKREVMKIIGKKGINFLH